MNRPSAQILSVQYLRALAVVGVVAYHAGQWERLPFEVGAAGVDLFFIVSGFILWTVTAGRAVTPLAFLRARALRVAPLYWLATAVALAVVAVRPGAISHVESEPLHVALSLLFVPHPDPVGYPFPVLDVGWTLTYEAFFYIVFASALRLGEADRARTISLVMMALPVIGFIFPRLYMFGANMMLLEFVAGLWLARAWRAGLLPRPAASALLIAAGLALLTVQHSAGYKPDLWRPLLWGPPCLMIATGALGLDRAGVVGDWPWLLRLGDASYSIYLAHTIIAPIGAHALGVGRPWLVVPVVFALGIAAGLVVHRRIEAPLLRWLGRCGRPAEPAAPSAS